ncbi:MAG: hypothetical protein H7Z21_04660 [Hymenobacter sp.]|nr:hypothetical protein [Hymenobacter sp.]
MRAPLEPEVTALFLKITETGDLEPEDEICKRVLSIHDHWLSEEEARFMLSFSTLRSWPDYRHYLKEEDKFVVLFSALFQEGDIFYFEHSDDTVVPLESWQQLVARTTTGLREKQHFLFYVRRFRLLLVSAYDLNVAVYFLAPQHQAAFADRAQKCRLHLL